jgi:hypothetical protein
VTAVATKARPRKTYAVYRISPAADPDYASYDKTKSHRGEIMTGTDRSPRLAELERRIAIARDNIRQLIEQAAAFSGAEDEDRAADRIAQQNEELDRLVKERDALLKK